jgi:hypothetical protein
MANGLGCHCLNRDFQDLNDFLDYLRNSKNKSSPERYKNEKAAPYMEQLLYTVIKKIL